MRRNLEETWSHLQTEEFPDWPPRTPDGMPFVPNRMPSQGDEEPFGISFFRNHREDEDFSNLTLPRTFFGRSEIRRVSFHNTDLTESRMCWTDFIECDFSEADLSRCDMRASVFQDCNFRGARLHRADLRRSSFEGCDFTDADLTEAISDAPRFFNRKFYKGLTQEQRSSVQWSRDPGSEPEGG